MTHPVYIATALNLPDQHLDDFQVNFCDIGPIKNYFEKGETTPIWGDSCKEFEEQSGGGGS